ncbi:related to Translocation protein SEC66 [Saccharomycodes ludwigii]|uniref:Related to Translocation protein SEC66 n=1 Tax=Saccharomycodes ludwigii TaxID=36035 RepID=A0A376B7F9_9ASCO|nr:hypothetical protein SCDLUD_002060 [Saccharomycodes ludwigii]KAH3902243.1 hypothetical protein SCDLUD_002060 [Saccharomycodes ludwigii]SSD60613.1 related to Translocation protein SEC66 [Saccharomycodes ludwigii]
MSSSSFNDTYEKFGNFTNGTAGNNTQNENVLTKKVSVYTPLIYVSILIISLLIFGSKYKKNQQIKKNQLPSIFDNDEPRNLYYQLKQMDGIHEKVLQAALLNRGAEAVRRSFKLKEAGPQFEILYKTGAMGDDYYERCQREVKIVEAEFKSCLQEAEMMQKGWAQNYVALCREICFTEALRRRYASIPKRCLLYKKIVSA